MAEPLRARWRASLARRLSPPPPARPEVPDQPPETVLELLRDLGAALVRAGDAADRVTAILDDVARAYSARDVRFIVFPTGVFVRIGAAELTRVDFAPAPNRPLRLDQIDAVYRIVDDVRHGKVHAAEASRRLDELLVSPPRFPALVRILGAGVLTVGLGLILHPAAGTLPTYLLFGAFVGLLTVWAERWAGMAIILPVVAAFGVSWAAFELGKPVLDVWPLDVVIPALVTLLPGAALTMATVELSAGSMISGASRLVYGLERLLLLTFGITLGIQVAGLQSPHEPSPGLGGWAPWLGVLVFAVGHFLASSVPRRTFGWLLAVLYVVYAAQFLSSQLVGALGASFVAGAVLVPLVYAIQQRPSGPPAMVTFLPAFWMLVPGALGLEGVTQLVGAHAAQGLGDFVNALMTIVAIGVGVLVGAGLSERVGRATGTWRGI